MKNKQLILRLEEDLKFDYEIVDLPDNIGEDKWDVVRKVEKNYKELGFYLANRKHIEIILKHRSDELTQKLHYIHFDKEIVFGGFLSVAINLRLQEYFHDEEHPSFYTFDFFPYVAGGRDANGREYIMKQYPKILWEANDRAVIVNDKKWKDWIKKQD